ETSVRLPITDLIRELFQKTGELVTKQVELTKAELKVEGRKLAKISVYGIVALHLSSMLVLLFGVSLFLSLAQAIGWLAAAWVATGISLVLPGILRARMPMGPKKAFRPIEE